ncbi:DUF488 family protein [Methanobacterium formicicum]|uniref:DUF488 domain-containing protein n=1 Tax=Methanobacterium formicicum (strain DSM 3637 / PP1) TaxID=1204725 RepID=K2R225_METFP|nr:DUF488 domain-containing protein [Methanobacterium formicicum]EKF86578.1 hypothetical protein A994_03808 [Methanobacterium formicicum DSM 3637]
MSTIIFTIGHSNHPFSRFIELIQKQGIQMVVDVRSRPYSKYTPYYSKKPLEEGLKEYQVEYLYLGNKIGGKPDDAKFYHDGELLYHLMEEDEKYQEGLKILLEISRDNRIVIMCSEEDPYHCHRHHLISQSLLKNNFQITHIRGNGNLEKVRSDYQTRLF